MEIITRVYNENNRDLGRGELPRPGPVFLTGDNGRGLSRWFRGEVSFGLKEADPPLWGRLAPDFGAPARDEKVTEQNHERKDRNRQTNWMWFVHQRLSNCWH